MLCGEHHQPPLGLGLRPSLPFWDKAGRTSAVRFSDQPHPRSTGGTPQTGAGGPVSCSWLPTRPLLGISWAPTIIRSPGRKQVPGLSAGGAGLWNEDWERPLGGMWKDSAAPRCQRQGHTEGFEPKRLHGRRDVLALWLEAQARPRRVGSDSQGREERPVSEPGPGGCPFLSSAKSAAPSPGGLLVSRHLHH